MEYAIYLNRIAEAYEAFLEQNATWIKQQAAWRAEDLARWDQREQAEQTRFEQRLEADHKVIDEFHARLERIYREEVRKDLELKSIEDLMKKYPYPKKKDDNE